jgi:hypothetical protein
MAENPSGGLQPALPDHRQRTVDALVRHYAADHITVDEFERRLDTVHRTTDPAVLDGLLRDLPAVQQAAPARAEPEADRLIRTGARAVADAVRESQTLVAVMGGVVRRGRWTPAQRTIVIALMGGVELDFRDARFGPGVTEVFVLAAMGGGEIIVPPGLRVDASGLAVMGAFDHQETLDAAGDADAPILKIRGLVVMGGCEIQVRQPGETAKEAKRRERDERKRLRGSHE